MSADASEASESMSLAPVKGTASAATPIPLPQDAIEILLASILTVIVLAALYFAASLAIPFVFAFVLNFLLQPVMRVFMRARLPKMLAALLVLLLFFGAVLGLGSSIAAPAAGWMSHAPESLSRFEARLNVLKQPFDRLQRSFGEFDKLVELTGPNSGITVKEPGFTNYLFSSTRSLLVGFFSMSVLLYFLLISGDLFLRRLVEILPRLSDKKRAVALSHEIERNISIYLVTITIMNVAVGILTAIATYLCGLSDPLLWGAMATVLNFILLLGPLTGIAILSVVGLTTFDTLWHALLPAILYLAIHLTESQVATPLLLARRFTLNPVAVIMSLLFWYWMWGVAGALLAIPMLATIKITCDRIGPLMALGHFLGGEPRTAEE
jgi:predicted PurR-regulated permease PerM